MKKIEALGIPNNILNESVFYDVNIDQDKLNELIYTQNFIQDFIQKNDFKELKNKKFKYKFINYGDMELVYVIKTEEGKYYTMLINQPSVDKFKVRNEYNNLNKLSKNDVVIKPLYYFENEYKSLYLTPYMYQARCISTRSDFGIYVPEPEYHFEIFDDNVRSIVNKVMIANIIKLYNEKENLGICDVRFTGGDFILEKEWSNEKVTIDNTIKRMKLVAARDLKKIPFDEYINLLKKELTLVSYYKNKKDRNNNILISQKQRLPMNKDEIEEGISLGLKLR